MDFRRSVTLLFVRSAADRSSTNRLIGSQWPVFHSDRLKKLRYSAVAEVRSMHAASAKKCQNSSI